MRLRVPTHHHIPCSTPLINPCATIKRYHSIMKTQTHTNLDIRIRPNLDRRQKARYAGWRDGRTSTRAVERGGYPHKNSTRQIAVTRQSPTHASACYLPSRTRQCYPLSSDVWRLSSAGAIAASVLHTRAAVACGEPVGSTVCQPRPGAPGKHECKQRTLVRSCVDATGLVVSVVFESVFSATPPHRSPHKRSSENTK